jgi:hypothetical protein
VRPVAVWAWSLVVGTLAVYPSNRLAAQTLDTIVIVTRNVFDSQGDGPHFVARLANALHVTTRPRVVRRALLIDPGQPYDSARVVESERSLRSLGVFREVRLDTGRVADGRLALRVNTADGWSTKPQATFSSAGGDATWSVALVEENLVGSATRLSASYGKTPDRRTLEFQYGSPWFLFRRAALQASVRNQSDGQGGRWSYGVPFYQSTARWSLVTDGDAAHERALVYRDDSLIGKPQRRAVRIGIAGGVALRATSRAYTRWWAAAQWRREEFADTTSAALPRVATVAAGTGFELSHTRLRVLRQFDTYGRREDVDLSQSLRLGVWVAPRVWGYSAGHAGIGPELSGQASAVWRGGFVLLRASGNGIFNAGGLDSGRAGAGLTIASQNLARQTAVLHVEAGVMRGGTPGSEFDLWRDRNGPRLFGAHAFTGTRKVWVAAEHRVLVADHLWGLVGVGLAPFLDYGGAWFDHNGAWFAAEPARLGGDAGVALRFGPTRAVHGDVTEVAVGVRFGEGVGTGKRWAVTVRRAISFK